MNTKKMSLVSLLLTIGELFSCESLKIFVSLSPLMKHIITIKRKCKAGMAIQ
ncbi:MAG: hypothetical protein JNK50_14980 [Bacteroidia bacterium]|nr:hypothetical protein [Bacteroidia bacterium]